MNVLTRPAPAAPTAAIAPSLPPFFTKFKKPVAEFLNFSILLAFCANFSGSFCIASSTASTQLIVPPFAFFSSN